MTVSEDEMFTRATGLSFTDIPDGLALNDTEGKEVHFLNPVASAIFLLCDGAHDARSIATILREEFSLADSPLADVLNCLNDLEANNLIQKIR